MVSRFFDYHAAKITKKSIAERHYLQKKIKHLIINQLHAKKTIKSFLLRIQGKCLLLQPQKLHKNKRPNYRLFKNNNMIQAYATSIHRKTICHASEAENPKANPMKNHYPKKLRAVALLLFVVALFAPRIMWGQFTYTSGYYNYTTGNLATAITNANAGSTIYVTNNLGVLNSTNNYINLTKNITIKSDVSGTKRTIKRTGTNQWIRVNGSYRLTIEDIVFDGQKSNYSTSFSMIQGSNSASINMNRCEVNNCLKSANGEGSSNNGAAINVSDNSSLTCTDVKFQNNTNAETHNSITSVVYGGGAIACKKSTFTLTRCEFYGNTAYEGGGAIFMEEAYTGLISNCIIGKSGSGNGNTAGIVGGGVYGNTYQGYTVTIDGTTRIEYNTVSVIDGNGSDKNYFGQGGGVYFINGSSTGNITIGDASGSNKVVISNNQARGGGGGVMFWCTATSSTVMRIQNFKMENNSSGNTTHNFYDPDYNYGGGGIFVVGNLDISHSANHIVIKDGTISDCYAIGYGGGLFINNHDCEVRNVTFKNNYTTNSSGAAGGLGGAVMVNGKASGSDYSHTDYFYNCEFYKNGIKKSNSSVMTTHGGALYSQNISNVQMLGCTVGDYDEDGGESRGNKATRNGGGICIEANSYLTLDSYSGKRGIVSYNQAADGGGIYVASGSQGHTNIGFNSSDYPVEICNNQAAMFGGGIYLDCAGHPDDQFSLQNFKLNENTALHGGGAYLQGGHVSGVNHKPMTIQNGTVQDNHASSMGGGIFFDEHDADVSNVYFIHNTTNTGTTPEATGIGGGVLIAGHSNHSVEDHDHDFTNCKFFQNEASYGGAAMVKRKTNADFINCTIGGSSTNKNTASIDGGGVYVEELSKAFFTSGTTISYNEAVDGGGIYVAGYEGSGTPNDYMNMVCEASVSVPSSSYGVYFGIYTKSGSTYNLVSGSSMTLMGTQSGVLRQTNLQRGVDYYVLSRPIPSDEIMYMYPIECSMSGIDGKIRIYDASWSTFTEYTSNTWNKPAWTSLSSLAYTTSYISGAYYYEIIRFRVIPDEDINASGYASLSGNTTVVANAASNDGGGIYIDNIGEVQLNGCTIGGSVNGKNTANNKGGGIYKLGTLKVQGTVNVTDNNSGTSGAKAVVPDNVYIPPASADDQTILITGTLTCGSSIGVTKTKKWMEPGTGTTNATSTEASPQYGSQGDHVYDMDDNFKQVRTAIAKVSPASSTENWALDAYKRNVFFDDKDNYHVWSFNYSKTNDLNNIKAYVDQSDYFIETWRSYADASGFASNTVSTPAGLAHFAKLVNTGNATTNAVQSATVDLSGHYWEPIGFSTGSDCTPATDYEYSGTYNGNGHFILNAMSILPTQTMGLFGKVTGTVKHTFLYGGELAYTYNGTEGSLGGIAGNADSGTIDGCEVANVTLRGYSTSSTNLCQAGGIAGIVSGEVRNSFTSGITFAGTITNAGGLVGNIASGGAVKNCYSKAAIPAVENCNNGALVGNNSGTLSNAYTSATSGAVVGSGTAGTNIYAAGPNVFKVGSTGDKVPNYTATIGADQLGYMYADNLVGTTPLFEQLTTNAKDLGAAYDLWARPALAYYVAGSPVTVEKPINDDLPVLLMDNYDGSGNIGAGGFRTVSNYNGLVDVLQYGGPDRDGNQLDGTLGRSTGSDSHFIYGDISAAPAHTPITANRISIYEHAAITEAGTLGSFNKTHVSITFDNSRAESGNSLPLSTEGVNGFESQPLPRDWHIFSTPLRFAPLGFNYKTSDGTETNINNLAYSNNPWSGGGSATTPGGTEFDWLGGGNNRYWMTGWTGGQTVTSGGYVSSAKLSDWTDGYFPSTFCTAAPISHIFGQGCIEGAQEYGKYPYGMDLYAWYEPEYHYINFKRNGPNHWHSDEPHGHLEYHYDNNKSNDDSKNLNETNLVSGKGYMASIAKKTLLQSSGALNGSRGSSTDPMDYKAGFVNMQAKAEGEAKGRTDEVRILATKNTNDFHICEGWNLVGNPFHAYLDFDAFCEGNSDKISDNTYLVYNADGDNGNGFRDNGSGFSYYVKNGSSKGAYASQYLHPHQGFFVKVGSTTELTFSESHTVLRSSLNDDNPGHYRGDDNRPAYPLVNLFLTSEKGCSDVCVVEFNRPEWGGGGKLREIYSGNGLFYAYHDDKNYAALFATPEAERIPIKFEAKEPGGDTYTITWNTANGDFSKLYLVDNMTGVQYDMLAHDSYSFRGQKGDYWSRFYIVFDVTGVEEEQDEDQPVATTFAFYDGAQWVVTNDGSGSAILQLIDLQGRVLETATLANGQTRVSLPNVATGMYLLRMSTTNGTQVQKIIVR